MEDTNQLCVPNQLCDTLNKLIQKHSDNEYVYGRLVTYIENILPMALDNAAIIHKQRDDRKNTLNANRDEFTSRFLLKNNYFYSHQTELFLHYDGLHFVLKNEDDIQHHILSTISSEKCLREWKYKVNKNILKRIKERSPLNATPESSTIQFVINTLCPAIFPTRNHVKYFLTIVGDCLSSKMDNHSDVSNNIYNNNNNNNIIYIFSPAMKEIIREIGNQCYTYFGLANIFSNIKFKYYDHKYSDCRLFYNEYGPKKLSIPAPMSKYMIDFLCVSSHYATRYGTADKFLNSCNDLKLVEHSLFLNKNTQESIVNNFIVNSLTINNHSTYIDVKNMFFLWKKFLNELALPNIIFYETLKTILKSKIKYDDEKERFMGVTSIHLPIVSLFMRFWEENIIETETDNEHINDLNNTIIVYELEIDELCLLFKSFTKNVINEVLMIELIQHFYPDLVIENNKYILNVKCKLWDKYNEVKNALEMFKKHKNEEMSLSSSPSLSTIVYDAYQFYCSTNSNKHNLHVSKRYFEKIEQECFVNAIEIW